MNVKENMLRAYYGVPDTRNLTALIQPSSPEEAMEAAAKVMIDDMREWANARGKSCEETRCESSFFVKILDAYEKERMDDEVSL